MFNFHVIRTFSYVPSKMILLNTLPSNRQIEQFVSNKVLRRTHQLQGKYHFTRYDA